jgi:thiamine-monophosphate kinase
VISPDRELHVSRRSVSGEEDLIRRIRRIFPPPPREVRVPIGDDAACIRPPARSLLVLTTDQMVEGIHFRRFTHPAELLGARALTVNLSDLSSMGARPRWFLLSLFLPRNLPEDYLEGILSGMAREARLRRVALVGGNLTAAPALALDISMTGVLPTGAPPLLRSGGSPGDILFVTGTLGGSSLGLELLDAGWRWGGARARRRGASRRESTLAARALRLHLCPSPDYPLAGWLSRNRIASAAIDISDGLSRDLLRLCLCSGAGARLDSRELPLEPAVVAMRGAEGALEMALHGGEEYQLLFAVPPARLPALAKYSARKRVTRIGVLTGEKGELLLEDREGKTRPLEPGGYDHFLPPTRRRRHS